MSLQKQFITMSRELKSGFYERDQVIDGALVAILSRHHMLQLGVPGTSKSGVTDAICRRITGARYFQWLLTRFSTPEELFGPVSLKGLEQDEYRRITTGKLPESHIAFVDEIFKGNAAILNSLLTAINERKFDNGRVRLDIPLVSVFGASNELPEEKELEALYDRFLLRYDVPYIQDGSNWEALVLSGAADDTVEEKDTKVSLEELQAAQAEVRKVKLPESVVHTMREIKLTLEAEGIVASDRRWKQTARVLQARAWLQGRDLVNDQDLEILCDMLWKEPEQRKTLVAKILSVTNPLDLEAVRYYDDCRDVYAKFAPGNAEETAAKLRSAMEKIDATLKIADPAKVAKMKEIRKSISGWYAKVIEHINL